MCDIVYEGGIDQRQCTIGHKLRTHRWQKFQNWKYWRENVLSKELDYPYSLFILKKKIDFHLWNNLVLTLNYPKDIIPTIPRDCRLSLQWITYFLDYSYEWNGHIFFY